MVYFSFKIYRHSHTLPHRSDRFFNFARMMNHSFMHIEILWSVIHYNFSLQVGTADALAFFLPGVVSQFAKVLHASKMMTSGAAGSGDAIDQAVRGLAEYLMIVLQDDANLSGHDMSIIVTSDKKYESTQSFMDELRQLPIKSHSQSKILRDDSSGQMITSISKSERKIDSGKVDASFYVNRTNDWIEKTSVHVDKLLGTTFRHVSSFISFASSCTSLFASCTVSQCLLFYFYFSYSISKSFNHFLDLHSSSKESETRAPGFHTRTVVKVHLYTEAE